LNLTELALITVSGVDRVGLIAEVTSLLARSDLNIIDIEQKVIQGRFFMFMVVEMEGTTTPLKELEGELDKKAKELELEIHFSPFSPSRKKKEQNPNDMHVITVLNRDRVGVVYDIVSILAGMKVNIEKTFLTARGDLISLELLVNLLGRDRRKVRRALIKRGEEVGLDIIMQRQDVYSREKRLIVFDMDSTIVDMEIINELARAAGVEEEVRCITESAMAGEIDFKEALRCRVKLLEGLPVKVLEEIAGSVRLTPGSEELLASLRQMGYKIALISGGFTYFTEKLKERFDFDYTFANRLVIDDGVLTGEVKEPIIDAERKGKIIHELAAKENITTDNIVAVGDGANDQIMLENAGLGVAFNAKELLKKVSDGSLSKENIAGLLNILGMPKKGSE